MGARNGGSHSPKLPDLIGAVNVARIPRFVPSKSDQTCWRRQKSPINTLVCLSLKHFTAFYSSALFLFPQKSSRLLFLFRIRIHKLTQFPSRLIEDSIIHTTSSPSSSSSAFSEMASSQRPTKNRCKRQVITSSSDTDTDDAPVRTRVVAPITQARAPVASKPKKKTQQQLMTELLERHNPDAGESIVVDVLSETEDFDEVASTIATSP